MLAALVALLMVAGCSDDSSNACDPIAQTGCEEGQVCEEVVDGGTACFMPVVLRGTVFDLGDDAGIAGATILGDGTVSLIIDVSQLLDLGVRKEQEARSTRIG